MEQIRDSAIFEMYNGAYILAEDSGYFTVGEVRDERMFPYMYNECNEQTITSRLVDQPVGHYAIQRGAQKYP